jgi:simple sugar transport system ATP-binding protein
LILDEPTAVLGPKDVDSLLGVIERLRDQESMSIVLISHKMKEIERVADRVSVLRRGAVVASTAARGMTTKELIALMVGGDAGESVARPVSSINDDAPVALALRGVSVKRSHGGLEDITFEVRAGEILGIAGVSGNGQSELVEVLSGTLSVDEGQVEVGGSHLADVTPPSLLAAGVGMLGEDRHAAAVHNLPVVENLVLDQLQSVTRRGHLDRSAMAERCDVAIRQFEIKATPQQHLGTLSGGNMQKVLLARLFGRSPKAAIVSQPTRGLDVSSTRYVRSLIADARASGTAVVLVSEDLDEVLELANRIAVMYRGRVVGILDAHEVTRERLGEMMAGVLV